ncbi:MAG: hypothetical protein EU539_08815 [Promethearchaeota archaeon]|nr:MAG: hypothetical protein EU539_08815 [Candidatus Lokiarchaeota archaeon]
MENKYCSLVGGIMMIISVFLPVTFYYFTYRTGNFTFTLVIFYWMFGYLYIGAFGEGYGETFQESGIFFDIEYVGLICMIMIILVSVIIIAKSYNTTSKFSMHGGILNVLIMFLYLVAFYSGFMITQRTIIQNFLRSGIGVMIPFLGVFLCLIGGMLSMMGGSFRE